MIRRLLAILLVAIGFAETAAASPVEVFTIKLSMSNVHVLKGRHPILIDAGGKQDMPELQKGLAAHDMKVEDFAAVIVTHGHSDHAALAGEIRSRSGAKVVLGKGDVEMARAGHNDDLKPTNFTAKILKAFSIDPNYPPLAPDIVVETEFDLSIYGYKGKVVEMPGHTSGSLVVILGDGRAFVGDVMLGGWMGGAVFPDRAGEHYFQADPDRNRSNIAALLNMPINTFYLGHGGPVSRASVLNAFGLK